MIPHQQMVVSGGFPTERRGFFLGKSEGQKRVSGGILRAEGGFPGIPHQQKVVGVLGDSPPAEDGFQGLPANILSYLLFLICFKCQMTIEWPMLSSLATSHVVIRGSSKLISFNDPLNWM